MTIRVLLCDDHQMFADGLSTLLNAEPDMCVVGRAVNGQHCLNAIASTSPDVVLMDINMPESDGLFAVEQASMRWPHLKILMLTMYQQEEYMFRAIRAGAHGYILKDAPIQVLIDAVRKVANGQSVLTTDIASKLIVSYREQKSQDVDRLSPREHEVLTCLVDGLSNKQIGEKLFITETTVKLHISNIYRKLGVRSRSQAIMLAVKKHIVHFDDLPHKTS